MSSTANGRILVWNETIFVEDAFKGFPPQILENFRKRFQPGFQLLTLPYSTVNSLEKSLDVVLAVQVSLSAWRSLKYVYKLSDTQVVQLTFELAPVRPVLAKFCQRGKFLMVYFLFGKMLSILRRICYIIQLIFVVSYGQNLKNNRNIWSHWLELMYFLDQFPLMLIYLVQMFYCVRLLIIGQGLWL